MEYLTIEGVKPYDGRYELDLSGDEFTTREWGWVKRHAGRLPGDYVEGLIGLDPELVCALALIALHRAGKLEARDVASVFERFVDAPFGRTIRLEFDKDEAETEEAEADPPPPSSSENGDASGHGSPTSSETSAALPSRSGIPVSASSGSA